MHIIEFIKKYLSAIGITDAEIDEYASKIIFTAAGTVLLELDEGESTHTAFAAAIEETKDGEITPFALLDYAFPDGRHHSMFKQEVLRTLLEIAKPIEETLDEHAKKSLAELFASIRDK